MKWCTKDSSAVAGCCGGCAAAAACCTPHAQGERSVSMMPGFEAHNSYVKW